MFLDLKYIIAICIAFGAATLQASEEILPKVHDIPGMEGATVEVRFTHPQCETHYFSSLEETVAKDWVSSKPQKVYCSGQRDKIASFNWKHSPRYKLVQWIEDPGTKEVFIAYQAISDSGPGSVLDTLCRAMRDRDLQLSVIFSRSRDRKKDPSSGKESQDPLIDPTASKVVEAPGTIRKLKGIVRGLNQCNLAGHQDSEFDSHWREWFIDGDRAQDSSHSGLGSKRNTNLKIYTRGHSGRKESDSIGWAHNKFFVVNPTEAAQGNSSWKFATGSGNLTATGVSLSHENWLFFEGVPNQSRLAQSLDCLIDLQKDVSAHVARSVYIGKQIRCHSKIPKDYRLAKGIQSFYVPGDGKKAIAKVLVPGISRSQAITMTTHLLFFKNLFVKGLGCAAMKVPFPYCYESAKDVPPFGDNIGNSKVRVLVDDDIYWRGQGVEAGYNMAIEAASVNQMERRGAEVKYMQTGHQRSGTIQLQHSKILLFEKYKEGEAVMSGVWTGAGNFTKAALFANFENYMYITIPSVVEDYREQLNKIWGQATWPENMTKSDVTPVN